MGLDSFYVSMYFNAANRPQKPTQDLGHTHLATDLANRSAGLRPPQRKRDLLVRESFLRHPYITVSSEIYPKTRPRFGPVSGDKNPFTDHHPLNAFEK